MVIPNRFPAQMSKLIKNGSRRRGNTELVPQATEEQGGNTERMALKSQAARQNVLGDRFQSGPSLPEPLRMRGPSRSPTPEQGSEDHGIEDQGRKPTEEASGRWWKAACTST